MLLQELVVRGYKADLRVQLVAPPPAADDGDQEDEGEDQEDAAAEEAAALDLEERLSDSTTSVSSPSDATSQAAARCDSHHLPFTNSLTRLVLHNVCLEGARSAVLYAVASLTALQHLDLDLSPFKGGIPGNILLHVTKLTHLGLHYGVNASTLDHIHRFQQLRQLSLGLLLPFSTSAHSQPATWQESGHCSSFRRCLFGAWFAFSPLNTPWLTSVSTGLHRLELHSVAHTQPAVLAGFSALQYLSIRGVIQSDGSRPPQNAIQAVAASEPAAGVAAGGGICMPATGWSAEAAGVWELLQVLPQLTALTHLNLPGLLETAAPVLPSCSFAALTASSRLRVLNISKAHIPPAAWQHKFPQAPQQQQRHQQRLSHLTHVTLTDVEVGPEAVAALVRCCPRLQHLSLTCCCGSATGMENRSSSDSESNNSHSMRREGDGCHQLPMLIQQQHPQLLPLLGLSCLTSLSLSSFNSGAAEIVAKISNLQHLRFYSDQTLPTSWLQPRMALTGLQLLSARSWSRLGGNSNAVVSDSSQDEKVQEALAPLVFINKAPYGAPPDVWKQLLARCAQAGELSEPPAAANNGSGEAGSSTDDGGSSNSSSSIKSYDGEGSCSLQRPLQHLKVD